MDVAVKTFKEETMEPEDFLKEAEVMTKMQHPALVQMHGVCTKERPMFLVVEFVSRGCLLELLRTDEGKEEVDVTAMMYGSLRLHNTALTRRRFRICRRERERETETEIQRETERQRERERERERQRERTLFLNIPSFLKSRLPVYAFPPFIADVHSKYSLTMVGHHIIYSSSFFRLPSSVFRLPSSFFFTGTLLRKWLREWHI